MSKLTGELPAKSWNTPYAATWPNGTALRVYVDSKGLGLMGISTEGIPFGWNKAEDMTETSVDGHIQICKARLANVGTNIELIDTELYADKSGGKAHFKFLRSPTEQGTGKCLFDTNKVLMVTTDRKADYSLLN
ncbi:hypothetical protein G3R49_04775 [Shewanella sp. WXL01]|uniref:hypothetical protein n=1 Tax=Shewanella sp. WXL01 TaxID=2709721 RepID=UPI00143867AF|nr:hypothetical protein [Shewanella sp. WXL01]NKF49884.1 hypothetical protein [Shewanella sp. WXL01]